MGYIKEPIGVDLVVSPIPLSIKDRQEISDIISVYKKTGETPQIIRKSKSLNKKKATDKPRQTTKKLASAK